MGKDNGRGRRRKREHMTRGKESEGKRENGKGK